jgi:hypothetical protein
MFGKPTSSNSIFQNSNNTNNSNNLANRLFDKKDNLNKKIFDINLSHQAKT